METGKIPDYITYPKTFEKYRWYKPLITAVLTIVIWLALCYISAQVIILIFGRQTIVGVFTVNLNSTSMAALSLYYFLGLLLPSLYIANRIVRDRPFSSYCSSRGSWNWMLFFRCAAITLAIYAVVTVIDMVVTNSYEFENRMSPAFVIIAIIVVPLQCLAEEFAFRGFLMQTLGSWFSMPVLALIIQAIAFTFMHDYNSLGMIAIFVSGITYGFLAWKSNGLEVSSAVHAINNLFAVMMEGMMAVEQSASDVSVEALVIDIIIQITLAAVIYYVGKRNGWFGEIS